MDDIPLEPINISQIPCNVPRQTPEPYADILSVWQSPFPVITSYLEVCRLTGLYPFGGGVVLFSNGKCLEMDGEDILRSLHEFWKMVKAGWEINYFNQGDLPGKIISGYRIDKGIHGCLLAIDYHVGNLERQIEVARTARNYFTCIGLYPQKTFIHNDISNEIWRIKHRPNWKYWVKSDEYHRQDSFFDMVRFANETSANTGLA